MDANRDLARQWVTKLYTHDLLLLLERILPSNAPVEKLRDDLALLSPYAVEIRYPDDWVQPSAEDAREARAAAERVLKWLKTSRPELVQNEVEEKPVGPEVEENAAR